jgi:signal transduction histidine kinase
VVLEVSGESRLGPEQGQRLYRIAQEALNNVVKHAQTDRARVTLRFADDHTFLEIRDHGKGFVPERVGAEGTHMGLASMRERAEQSGGVIQIDSRPGGGTRVLVEIPAPGREDRLERAQVQV